jgi:hypothetical protein
MLYIILSTVTVLYSHPSLHTVVLSHGDVSPPLLTSFKFAVTVEAQLKAGPSKPSAVLPSPSFTKNHHRRGDERQNKFASPFP